MSNFIGLNILERGRTTTITENLIGIILFFICLIFWAWIIGVIARYFALQDEKNKSEY